MKVTCKNENCKKQYDLNTNDLEVEYSESSGNHSTQYLYVGEVTCPSCRNEQSINYTCDIADDNGELLSEELT